MYIPSLKLHPEEFGRFLRAYNADIFPNWYLGQAFCKYYGIKDPYLLSEKDEENSISYIGKKYIGRLD